MWSLAHTWHANICENKIELKYTMRVKMKLLSCVWLFVTSWTVAYQAPPSMGFSRQEYWSGLPFPSPGNLPQTRDWTRVSHIVGRHFTVWATREVPNYTIEGSKREAMNVYHRILGNHFNDKYVGYVNVWGLQIKYSNWTGQRPHQRHLCKALNQNQRDYRGQ